MMKRSWITENIIYQYQKQIERRLNKKSDGRYVTMFHQVEENRSLWYDDRYAISVHGFCEFIEQLQRKGYEIVAPYDILNENGKKKVVLSFDDAFDGVYYSVYPFLKENNIPFVIFAAIDKLNEQGFVNRKMLTEMYRAYDRCYVGAHSISHCNLSDIPKADCQSEIEKSGDMLEELIGHPVDIFAYPYGSLSAVGKRERMIARSRYKLAFGTLQTGVTTETDPMYIPRININEENYVNRIV